MAVSYPSSLACPQLSGFGISVSSGVLRSDMAGAQVQRRAYDTMPHSFRLSFAMSVIDWGNWQAWVTDNAYSWFEMDLPSMYAGRDGVEKTPTLIRFVSGVTVTNLTERHVQISVVAEMAPSIIRKYREAI